MKATAAAAAERAGLSRQPAMMNMQAAQPALERMTVQRRPILSMSVKGSSQRGGL